MIAHWIIKHSGEKMQIEVVANYDRFKELIQSHPGLQWVGWGSTLQKSLEVG